eukprot:scaffold6_cov190-Alexandrium_tamarense.AAC.48
MSKWDDVKVFQFLERWYWPEDEDATVPMKSSTRKAMGRHDMSMNGRVQGSETATSLLLPSIRTCLLVSAALVFAVLIKRRERRKKFVDSRYMRKKQGYF